MPNSDGDTQSTIYCYSCGEGIHPTVSFCPECGADQSVRGDTSTSRTEDNTEVGSDTQADKIETDSTTNTGTSDNQNKNPNKKQEPSMTLLGIETNPSWGYTAMYVSFIIVFIGAIADPLLLILGYIATGVSIYADVNYVSQRSDWEPSAFKYIAGIILLFIVFFPLYFMRRRRAMRNVVPIN